jgi:hypothetical protein
MKGMLIAAVAGATVVFLSEQAQAYADQSAASGSAPGALQTNARYLAGAAALVVLHHLTKGQA